MRPVGPDAPPEVSRDPRSPLARLREVYRGYASLPAGALIICLGTMINNLGTFVSPFLTLILTDPERGRLTADQAGLFVTLSSLVALGGILIGGRLTDSIGRKLVLAVFTGLAILLYVACAFALDRTLLLVGLLMLFSLCNAIAQPVNNTILMDVTRPEQRQRAFSLQYIAVNVGYAVGPLMAGLMYRSHLQLLFLLDATTTFLSLLLALAFIPETHPRKTAVAAVVPEPADRLEAPVEGSTWSILRKRPQLLFFILTNVLLFFVFSQFGFGGSLQSRETFGVRGETLFGIMMSVNAVEVVLLTIPALHLFRRRDPLVAIAVGSAFYAVGFGMLAFVGSIALFVVSTVVWSIGEILVTTSTKVYLASHTPSSHRGRFNAILPIIRRLGFAAGPALSGVVAARFGIAAIWLPTALMALVAGGLTVRLLAWQRKASEEEAACPLDESMV